MAAIPFETRFDPRAGEVVRLTPLVRRVVCDNAGPFTYTGTCTYLVGRGDLAVIDPGPDDSRHLDALLRAVAGERVVRIIVTHTHRDHSPLAARLKAETGGETLGFGPHGSGRPGAAGAGVEARLDASGDLDFSPDRRLGHGDIVEGSGWTLEALHTPGHTSNHLAFALKEENALFSGDHVMAWSTSVIAPPDGNMADYFRSLRLLLDRSEEVYWPGHGPEKRDPRPFVRAFITHRQMRETVILNRIRAGDRTIPAIVSAVYAEVDPKLHPAAALSAFAHVEHLVEQGKIEALGPLTLDGEYRAL